MDLARHVALVNRQTGSRNRTETGRFVAVGSDILHYQSAGPETVAGAGLPLVLLHGLIAWSYTWRHNLLPLAARRLVLAPDLRGFGLSSRAPTGYSLWTQAGLVTGFLDALGVQRAVLVGHSMGGEIAMRLALTEPERVGGLVLVGSAGLIRAVLPAPVRLALRLPGLGRLLIRLLFFNRRFVRTALATAYAQPGRPVDPEVAHGYLLPSRLPTSARTLLQVLREVDFGASAGDLARIDQPSLVLWGERDPWVPLPFGKQLAAMLPRSELQILPGVGHLPHEQAPGAFNALVLDWLHRQP